VSDYFELLNEPRRPWLDADSLKRKFLAHSASLHPDKVHTGGEGERAAAAKKFAELNAAHQCLADPKTRLMHLVELETGARPNELQQIPNHLADVFAEVGTLCQGVDAFLAQTSASPLIQAQRFERGQEWIERLNQLKNKLGDLRRQLEDGLKSLDGVWTRSDKPARRRLLPAVEECYRLFGYFNRWNSQIQERLTRLIL